MLHRTCLRLTFTVLTAGGVLSVGLAYGQLFTAPANEHPNPYVTINDHFKMPPGRTWESTSAVDIDPDGTSIWVGERCGANSCAESDLDPILKFDKDGNLVKSFGAGMLIFPHGIHVDRRGNVWVTDAQSPNGRDPNREGKGHAVYKFNPDGELLLTLGRPGVAGELTDEEVAQIQSRAEEILNGTSEQAGDVLGDSLFRQAVEDPTLQRFDAVTGNYNTFWIADRSFDNRTSLIVDPENGRIPPLTEETEARQKSQFANFARFLKPEGPEDTGLTVRCISYGVPNLLTGYNSFFQIAQSPTHVVILQELIHDARVIPLDGRPHLDEGIRQWHGDLRGHWEGDTLVVVLRPRVFLDT